MLWFLRVGIWQFMSKTKQCRMPHEVYYILSLLASGVLSFVDKGVFYILILACGFRRCLVLTNWAMPEPLHVERVPELALLCSMYNHSY